MGKESTICAEVQNAGRNFGHTDKKAKHECMKGGYTIEIEVISASPKKNENKYSYSILNQKAGRNFGQKG